MEYLIHFVECPCFLGHVVTVSSTVRSAQFGVEVGFVRSGFLVEPGGPHSAVVVAELCSALISDMEENEKNTSCSTSKHVSAQEDVKENYYAGFN